MIEDVLTLEDFLNRIDTSEHRYLIKELDGSYREENDEEFGQRIMNKYMR